MRSWRFLLAVLVPYLILMSAIAFGANFRFHWGDDPSYDGGSAPHRTLHWFYGYHLARWDAAWYLDIAREGYTEARTVFFPVYPMLVRALHVAIPDPIVAATIISLLASIGSAALFLRIGEHALGSTARAHEALWLLLFFPSAFFLFAPYTESTFLFFLLLVLFGIERRGRALPAIAAAALSATRVTGILSLILFVGDFVRHRHERGAVATLCIRIVGALGGIAAYMAYLHVRFGDALLFIRSQGLWNRTNGFAPAQIMDRLIAYIHEYSAVASTTNLAPLLSRITDLSFFLFAVTMIIWMFLRWRRDYALWSLAMIGVPLLSGTLISMPRYVLPIVFIPLMLARNLHHPLARRWVFIVFVTLWALLLSMFAAGQWIA